MSTLQRFLKDTFVYGLAAVLPRAVNVGLVKLHTASLAASSFAVNTDYYIYAAYLNALLTYGMETAFFRFFSKEKSTGKVIGTSFLSLLASTLLFMGLLFFFNQPIAQFFGFENPWFFKLLIGTITIDTLLVIPYAYLRVNNKALVFTAYKTLHVVIFAVLNLFFLWWLPSAIERAVALPEALVTYYQTSPKVLHIFVAGFVASVFTFIGVLPTLLRVQFSFDFSLLKKMLRYSLPIMIGGLAFVTNENLDKLILGDLLGKEEMGIYAACYKLGVFMTLYIMAFRLGAEPFFFNQSTKDNAQETYATVLTWFTILGAFFMIFIVVFIDFFAGLLLGNSIYFKALQIVPIILLANLFLGIYNNLSIWYKLTDKTAYGMYFSVFGACITIALNLLLIPIIGFIASAWATLCTYATMVFLSYFFGKKHYPVPYQIYKIGGYLLLAAALSGASFMYFRANLFFAFFSLCFFLSTVFFTERKQLQQLLKK